MSQASLEEVAARFGMSERAGRWGPCPACGVTHTKKDKRPPVRFFGKEGQRAWTCSNGSCPMHEPESGDVLSLACWCWAGMKPPAAGSELWREETMREVLDLVGINPKVVPNQVKVRYCPPVTWFRRRTEPEGILHREVTWDRILDRMENPPEPPEGGKDDLPLWTFGEFEGNYRSRDNIQWLHALHFDYDDADPSLDARVIHDAFSGYCFAAHTTFSHTPEKPSWRVIVPTEHPIGPAVYRRLMPVMADRIGLPGFDVTCRDPARAYYMPVLTEHYRFVSAIGANFDIEDLLKEVTGGR